MVQALLFFVSVLIVLTVLAAFGKKILLFLVKVGNFFVAIFAAALAACFCSVTTGTVNTEGASTYSSKQSSWFRQMHEGS
mmetsp:Transcript_11626/g.29403  ORF Transcript_11626/g.29403 Transcript_11626/m.29403 type:complete len:80 (-) Transcript_11626:126-365(-)